MKEDKDKENDFISSMSVFLLIVMFIFFYPNKDDEFKNIEKQLDEIKGLLTDIK